VPTFGYKNHVGIDRRHGLIRTWTATDAARHDGAQLPSLLSKANTASDVWADTAYRSKANEAHLAGNGFRSRIHRKKPPGKPMARNIARTNGEKSKVRVAIEHVFARQKGPWARGAHGWLGESPDEDRTGQFDLQHESGGLAQLIPDEDRLRAGIEGFLPRPGPA
jgi:IS5 family transposase